MKTTKTNIINEIIIKNSRFICFLFKIDNDNIIDIINEIKKVHPKATHFCYGYIYDEIKKSSDDGEPSGTAGIPILNVLEKENLNYVLAVVVRYFGGIKLGAGGLVRAYTKSVTEALKNTDYYELEEGYKILIKFSYNEEKDINYILNNSKIINKEYLDEITYECLVNDTILNNLNKYQITIIEKQFIEKK